MESPTKANKPLGERDPNSPVSPQKRTTDEKPISKSLEEGSKPAPGFVRPAESDVSGTYISPSDAIMSPASQKLQGMKGRRFANAKPKSLFAKMTASKLKEQPVQDSQENKPVSDGENTSV